MLVLPSTRRENFIARILAKGEKLSREMIENLLREVAEERDLLQVIFNSMAEGVMAVSEEGLCILVNRAASQLLGLRQDEILGNPVLDHLPEGDLREATRRCLEERDRVLWQEVAIFSPVERIMLLTVIPMQDRSDRYRGIVMLFFDVTERKTAEERLKQTEKLAGMTTLSARVSHELRNPLNNLQIYTQLAERELRKVKEGDPDSLEHVESASQQLKVVRDEIQRLNDTLEEFLVAVRPTRPLLDDVDVYSLVEGVLRVMDPELRERNIRVDLNLKAERIPPVLADESQLRFAVRNLLQNAMEAVDKNGEITITLDSRPNDVMISVADNGPGILDEIQERIFEPYFSTKTKGSGLGLVTVRRVAEDHGGKISVHSEPGKGAEFTLAIPRRRDRSRLIPLDPQRGRLSPAPASNTATTVPGDPDPGSEILQK